MIRIGPTSTTKTSGTVTVQASAGGATTSVALTVGAGAREVRDPAAPQPRALPLAIPTVGDRAAM